MRKSTVIIISFLLLQMNCPVSYGEEYVLVCHKECPVDTLTAQEVKRIFLGKKKKWADGSAIDIVVNANNEVHGQFTRTLLGKSPAQFSNYWRKILFSGRSMLPVSVKNDVDAKSYMTGHPNALTYVGVTSLDTTVKKLVVVK